MVLLHENIEKMVVPETIEKIGIIEYITLFMENVEIEVNIVGRNEVISKIPTIFF